jgi:hypothetical protein
MDNPEKRDMASEIDKLLEENKAVLRGSEIPTSDQVKDGEPFVPYNYSDVYKFTNRILHGRKEDKDELSELKNVSVGLLKEKVYKNFAESQSYSNTRAEMVELMRKYKGVAKEDVPETAKIKVREYRDRSLANVLSTDPDNLPDDLKKPTLDIQSRFKVLKNSFVVKPNWGVQ